MGDVGVGTKLDEPRSRRSRAWSFEPTGCESGEDTPHPADHTVRSRANLGTLWTTEVAETDFTATREWGAPGSHSSTSLAGLNDSTHWSGAGPATYHQAGAAPGPRGKEAAWLVDPPEGAWSAGLRVGPLSRCRVGI